MKRSNFSRIALSASLAALTAGLFLLFQGCQKQDDLKDNQESALLSSPEMEDYIIAGVEYQQALGAFRNEICKIDFSELRFTEDENGRMVMRLPIAVPIEKTAADFQSKKEILTAKFPQFAEWPEATRDDCIENCIRNSVKVNARLLELGVNIDLPLTKGDVNEQFDNPDDIMHFLSDWVQSSQYVEVAIVSYKNGTMATYVDKNNTPTHFEIHLEYTIEPRSGERTYYWPDASRSEHAVKFLGHTQLSGSQPSELDRQQAAQWKDLDMRIYYNGAFYKY